MTTNQKINGFFNEVVEEVNGNFLPSRNHNQA